MCGEYSLIQLPMPPTKGSPPHVWRILDNQRFFKARTRITSTCVENTILRKSSASCCQDHLHMCGEYFSSSLRRPIISGSPPHVWRILQRSCLKRLQMGITSTCVENTATDAVACVVLWDHLHMCGEYYHQQISYEKHIGSPPHVWRIPAPP